MQIRPIEIVLAEQLKSLGWTLSLAESCTGGLISNRITNVPGSSEYFMGGVVAYSNQAKRHLLNVSQETLDQFGAVSQETVLEMARGAQKLFGTHTAIAVSGIAGPSGGSPQKPVGTVWIGIAVPDHVSGSHYRFFGSREQIKCQCAEIALWLLAQKLTAVGRDANIQRQVQADQPIPVDFSGDAMDTIRIRAIYWQEKWIPIESIGRRWQTAQGSHFLVMNYQGKVYELIWTAEGCWYLRPPREALECA